jgi:hypothetical protein
MRLGFLGGYPGSGFEYIYISNVSSIGHIYLKRSLRFAYDNRRISILIQNKINIRSEECALSVDLMTSEILSSKDLKWFLYLSFEP